MSKEEIKKSVKDFLDTLEKEALLLSSIDKNSLLHLKEILDFKAEDHQVLNQILDSYKKGTLPIPRDNFNAFFIFYVLDSFIFNVEFALKILKTVLDPVKIIGKFNPRTPYGFLIDRLADTMSLSTIQRDRLKELFFVDLRNAIAHMDFEMDHHSFSYKNNKDQSITYTIEKLPDLMLEYRELANALFEFLKAHTEKD
ncbi:MAG: hypothetical protein HZA84_03825 [Thaumarchaeota archaeon]|nr:hypothetical protein [Nitrososphaerota archaeon]